MCDIQVCDIQLCDMTPVVRCHLLEEYIPGYLLGLWGLALCVVCPVMYALEIAEQKQHYFCTDSTNCCIAASIVVMLVCAVIKLVFYEPSDSQRAEKEAIDVQLQEKNTEIEKLKRDLQAMRVSSL